MNKRAGFTLVELSIVLVIIGLMVGGVLVGRDMIKSAGVRSQISQIEKFTAAENTFSAKYDCLPGDCQNGEQLGFPPRGASKGMGDGDGLVVGSYSGSKAYWGATGEPLLFWVDLSMAKLIDGNFTTATSADPGGIHENLAPYLPQAKIGTSNWVIIYADASYTKNYFNITHVFPGEGIDLGAIYSAPAIPVNVAFNIDNKLDDGNANTGRVLARYLRSSNVDGGILDPGASCHVSGIYAMSTDNGNTLACALAFEIQQ